MKVSAGWSVAGKTSRVMCSVDEFVTSGGRMPLQFLGEDQFRIQLNNAHIFERSKLVRFEQPTHAAVGC
jgi:hypothetical protein